MENTNKQTEEESSCLNNKKPSAVEPSADLTQLPDEYLKACYNEYMRRWRSKNRDRCNAYKINWRKKLKKERNIMDNKGNNMDTKDVHNMDKEDKNSGHIMDTLAPKDSGNVHNMDTDSGNTLKDSGVTLKDNKQIGDIFR